MLPQLLHFLQVDKDTSITTNGENTTATTTTNRKDYDIDWGTLDVYSCCYSCEAGNCCYYEEVVIVQPPPSFLTDSK